MKIAEIALCAVMATPVTAQQTALDEATTAEMKSLNIPGAAVVIIRGTTPIYAKAFGVANAETRAPVTLDTAFELASLTKTFTAMTLLTYAERKVIDLDAPVSRYIALPGCLGSARIGQLLSNTAGIRDEPDEFGTHDDNAMAEFVRSWREEDFCLFAPGTTFSYSNASYTLAGFVLEKIAGKAFPDLVAATVLSPLKMTHGGFRTVTVMTYPFAVGHKMSGEVIRPLAEDSRQWPAGGLFASANDLSRFAIALLNDGMVDGQQVIAANVVRTMFTPRVEIPALRQQYGYGLFINDRVVEHAGSNPGFTAVLRMRPDEHCAVIALANSDAFLRSTAQRALETCTGRAAPAPIVANTIVIPPQQTSDYEGTYAQPRRWTIEVVRSGDALVLKQFGKEFPLLRVAGDRLAFLPAAGARPKEIVFHRDSSGKIDLLQEDLWAFKKLRASAQSP